MNIMIVEKGSDSLLVRQGFLGEVVCVLVL